MPTLQHNLARISSQCILINNLFIIHVYIPPQASILHRLEFWENLNHLALEHHRQPLLVCVDRIPWTIQNDSRPTRHNNALDVCLTNYLATQATLNWTPLDEDISDHLPCLIETEHLADVRAQDPRIIQHCTVLDTEASLRKFDKWMKTPSPCGKHTDKFGLAR